ncbi:carboxymuconolactone decarboxylase family protein [Streptomyces sp. NE06-03E]|uniref:carboxymuconolactone decarboxylase family protein n=1 Tax=unclassified Streptomyces TaxID=2593676 RepID=UPI0029BDE255|nr:carboxymuconolactone decarboxylase family protein [Streptomyces sp. NE06-03E]MDX3054299.1 carboxymuconolactone decarboxylase family protein [Streptomyces sp. NE06-03E]
MQERMRMDEVAPGGYRKVMELFQYSQATVDPVLLELIMLRASVVNGCAFCVDMHSADAIKAGESARRLFAVSAWRESPFFSEEERTALAVTDAVTKIGDDGIPAQLWAAAREIWSEKKLADIVMAAIMINSFNRIAISSRALPEGA